MPSYRFRAHSVDGKPFQGVIRADDLNAVRQELEVRRLILDEIVPERTERRSRRNEVPSSRAMVEFARQFATLLEAFVPVVRALETVANVTRDRALRRTLEATVDSIRAGSSLAEAMGAHPRVFSNIFISTVAAGERGGNLSVGLLRVADHMERTQELRERILAALAYPAVIVVAAIGSLAALFIFVVPTFEEIFTSNGIALPSITLLFVNLSKLFVRFWLLGIGVIIAGIIVVRVWYRSEQGRRTLDSLILRLPFGGELTRRLAVARFSRTAASLLASGVPILDALEAAARTCGNVHIEEALSRGRDGVAAGRPLAEQLSRESELPPLLASMVEVGEETGQLDRMLDKVADFHDREAQSSLDGLLKVVEPALVVVVGIVLGAIVIAMYLPIIDAVTAVG